MSGKPVKATPVLQIYNPEAILTGREGNECYKLMKIGLHEVPKQTYSYAEYMKPLRSINRGQTEEESNEEDEDAAQSRKI